MKKILIVEDEEFLSSMYETKFIQEGYKTLVAHNGEEGVKLAKDESPDLILLDLALPKIDGYEVLRQLRADNKTKNTKIYILSNLGQDQEINKSFDLGADGYFIKANLTPNQLVQNIEKIFGGESVGVRKKPKLEPIRKKVKPESGPVAASKGIKILLIEDEEAIINMYKLQLEKEGYEVAAAKNGAWGLKLAKANKFDIIIMDMVMPAMNGYAAIKELKSDENSKNVPIIVLSNSAQDRDVDQAKKLGATRYLLKSSITPAKLTREIEKILK